ncbi:MAG: M23 family metallopeptidase [Calditrichaeota bacterium]|nr:M23 family metallopeptidase [Calditrichota bacterium]
MKYFLALHIFLLLHAQNYKWPTDASYGLTSAFAEYRENRFHAGIDISTWNKEGYKVFAIDTGYVYRIWTQPYGYGRALYIKLNDGRIVVYGHLQRYSKKIESYIRSIQVREKKYNQNVYLRRNQIPVSKGEVVALTGSTGIGTPHLHFEIRENMNTNLHTLQFYPWFKDNIYPSVAALAAVSLDDTTLVNGNRVFTDIKLKEIKKHMFQAMDTLRIDGKAGLTINVYDQNYKSSNTTGVDELSLFINGELVFNSRFRETLYSKNHYVNLDRNFFFVKYYGKRYQNLFLHPDNKLDAYIQSEKAFLSTENIGSNVFDYRIIVSDYKKNQIEISGSAKFEEQEESYQPLEIKEIFQNNPLFYNNHLISVTNGKPENTDQLAGIIYWDKTTDNRYDAGDFRFVTDQSDLYQSTFVTHFELDKSLFPTVDYKSAIIYFVPYDLLLKNRITVQHLGELGDREAIYSWDERKKRWDFRRFDYGADIQQITERSLELYTVIKDTVPPAIRFVSTKKSKTLFLVSVDDDLSGIHDEENYELFSGDQKIIAEYDYEDNVLRIEPDDIQRNQYLKIYLRDNVGNYTADSLFVK